MKIPRFQSSGVPGAEQQSVGAVVSAGRAKMYGGLHALNKVVDEFGQRILKEEQDAEFHRLSRNMRQESEKLAQGIYERDKVDEFGDPTHGTMEDDFTQGVAKIREGLMDRVKFRQNDQALTQEFDRLQDGFAANIRKEVRTRQVSIRKAEDIETLNEYLLDTVNGWNQAQAFFEDAAAFERYTATDIVTMRDKFHKSWFTNKTQSEFQEAMEQGLTQAQEYQESVIFPDTFTQEDIDRSTGYMTRQINAELNQIERDKNKAEREARDADNKAWAATSPLVTTVSTGQIVSQEMLEQLHTYIENPNSDPARVAAAQKAIAINQETTLLFSMGAEDRMERIIELQQMPLESDEQRVVRDSVIRVTQQIDAAIAQDPYRAYIMYGGGKTGQISLADAHKSGDLREALQAQMQLKTEVAAWVGTDIPALSDKDVVDLIKIGPEAFPEILKTWGANEAKKVLGEVYKKGANEMAFAGSLALQHDGGGAWSHYLKGSSITSGEGKDFLPENSDERKEIATQLLGQVFPDRPAFQNGIIEIAEKIYASMSSEAGDRTGKLNEDRYQAALKMAMGGLITRGDSQHESTFVPPHRDMTDKQFQDKLANLTMDDVNAMGGFKGDVTKMKRKAGYRSSTMVETKVTPEEILADINAGKVKIHMTPKRGQYWISINNMYVANADGGWFVLNLSQEQ